ncbi:MAG: RagB/SusD family nutrient uptake outer membrane protein [Candidatus Cryptobacteroides sp.]
MTGKLRIIVVVLASLMFGSCALKDFLDKPVSSDVTVEDIFSSRDLATKAMVSCYANLPFGLPMKAGADGDGNRPLTCVGQGILDNLSDITTNVHGTKNGPKFFYYIGNYNSSIEQNTPGYVKYSYTGEKQWLAIRRCWTIIENIDNVEDMTEAEKSQYKAEAKTIIALHYTEMLRHFGGVPKVDHYYQTNEDMHNDRMTVAEMVDWIDSLIEEACPYLPYEYEDPNLYGRMTKLGAMAIRVRALHFAASPLFNDDKPYLEGEASRKGYTWLGKKDMKYWEKTMSAADELIKEAASQGYGLVQPETDDVSGYKAAFRRAYFEPGNKETLIVTRCQNATYPSPATGQFLWFFQLGSFQVTQNWADMFPTADGYDIKPGMPNYDPACGWDEQRPHDNRDPRYSETVAYNNDDWGTDKIKVRAWMGGNEHKTEEDHLFYHGATARKFSLGGNTNAMSCVGKPFVWPWIRMAEIYLIYAEAANQFENGPSQLAYERVNAVRSRVGLSPLKNMDMQTFHNAVMKERACELGMENCRWFDIVRWKMEDAFKATLRGMRSWLWTKNPSFDRSGKKEGTRANGYDGDYLVGDGIVGEKGIVYQRLTGTAANVNFDESKHIITYQYYDFPENEIRDWAKNFNPKWYLSAFPMGEVNKDYGLIQNPGW